MTDRAVVVLSGGMDSTTAAYVAHATNNEVIAVSVDYGQRHRRELDFAAKTAAKLGARHALVDLHGLTEHLHGSALTDGEVAVPHGHYAADTMRATVVPNRNAILLSIATGIAVAEGATSVWVGVHAGDHFIYPDCRPPFIAALNAAFLCGTEGFAAPGFGGISTPFLHMTKADIVTAGDELDVPWADTWSCYEGDDIHCGRCGTCYERREAFTIADVDDPTEYANPLPT